MKYIAVITISDEDIAALAAKNHKRFEARMQDMLDREFPYARIGSVQIRLEVVDTRESEAL